jgi:hypothetical protein
VVHAGQGLFTLGSSWPMINKPWFNENFDGSCWPRLIYSWFNENIDGLSQFCLGLCWPMLVLALQC